MGGGGLGTFEPQEFFSLSSSLGEFLLGLIGVHEFFSFNFPLREYFFLYFSRPPIIFLMVRLLPDFGK